MRRLTTCLSVLAIGLSGSAAAEAGNDGGGAGFNQATRALEAAFKTASNERIQSDDGCYPVAADLAVAIGGKVAPSVKAVKKSGVVHVVDGGTNCSKVLLAYRSKGSTWVLNSQTGNVVQK